MINPIFYHSGFSFFKTPSLILCTPPPNGPLRNTNNNVTLNTATAGDLLQIVCAKNACQRTF